MSARSAVHVYVTSKDGAQRRWLSPGDEVPSWAHLEDRNLQGSEEQQPFPAAGASSAGTAEPSRSGKGSGLEAWRSFAESQGVGVGSEMSRDDIIAACEQAGVLASEG
ncbi:hypothetical protein OG713_34910 [Streptomyces sp. NBC_00723]|uniref:hypothetical protein n=1 Tax=Streptomyces sp. NBC_00723 TaxID=2903673 RepID=UPI00386A2A11